VARGDGGQRAGPVRALRRVRAGDAGARPRRDRQPAQHRGLRRRPADARLRGDEVGAVDDDPLPGARVRPGGAGQRRLPGDGAGGRRLQGAELGGAGAKDRARPRRRRRSRRRCSISPPTPPATPPARWCSSTVAAS
jgi:hypothetical protein